jgi:hypothetical protein
MTVYKNGVSKNRSCVFIDKYNASFSYSLTSVNNCFSISVEHVGAQHLLEQPALFSLAAVIGSTDFARK